jgi:hypothetical protein
LLGTFVFGTQSFDTPNLSGNRQRLVFVFSLLQCKRRPCTNTLKDERWNSVRARVSKIILIFNKPEEEEEEEPYLQKCLL